MSFEDWTSRARVFRDTGLISHERMRAVDRNARAAGLSSLRLMESAGHALAARALSIAPSQVLVLCGWGNNGGDGLVAARHLANQCGVCVCYPETPRASPEFRDNLILLKKTAAALCPVTSRADVEAARHEFSRADLIIDAILGTGGTGVVREPLATMVRETNASDCPVLSADIPTPGIRPGTILAFHRPKVEGSEVVDIGIPVEAEVVVGEGDLLVVPRRRVDAHKGAGGRVLVIGGGPYQGAPYLAALAALRAGADLVRVASPVCLQYPDLIIDSLEGGSLQSGHVEFLLSRVRSSDVVILGNGAGEAARPVLRQIAPFCEKAVFDADALEYPIPAAGQGIYTPHAGEFERMTGASPPADVIERGHAVRTAAFRIPGGVLLLKGQVDVISDGERVRFNTTGCPPMTVGGTGDVLAGIAGALFCRLPAFEAALVACYVNGRAGEKAAETYGEGMMASDLLNTLAGVVWREKEDD